MDIKLSKNIKKIAAITGVSIFIGVILFMFYMVIVKTAPRIVQIEFSEWIKAGAIVFFIFVFAFWVKWSLCYLIDGE